MQSTTGSMSDDRTVQKGREGKRESSVFAFISDMMDFPFLEEALA